MKPLLAEAGRASFARQIEDITMSTPVTDIHTHLYDPAFKGLLLWGIDDLLVYHYLVAESFRYLDLPYEKFWLLSKTQQADLIWDALFIRHSPISEACRGVLTTLHALGLDVKKRDLPAVRAWFAGQRVEKHITRCMELAGVRKIYMTNSPFDDLERPVWEKDSAGMNDSPLRCGLTHCWWPGRRPPLGSHAGATKWMPKPRHRSLLTRCGGSWPTGQNAWARAM